MKGGVEERWGADGERLWVRHGRLESGMLPGLCDGDLEELAALSNRITHRWPSLSHHLSPPPPLSGLTACVLRDHFLLKHPSMTNWQPLAQALWRIIPGLNYSCPHAVILSDLLDTCTSWWGCVCGIRREMETVTSQRYANMSSQIKKKPMTKPKAPNNLKRY